MQWIRLIDDAESDALDDGLDELEQAPRRRRPWRRLLAWLRRRWRRVLITIGAVLVVAVAAEALLLWNRVEQVDVDLAGSPAGGTTYLLVGSDSREYFEEPRDFGQFGTVEDNPGERADVVLAVRIRDDGSTSLLKIPRDLLVMDETFGPERLAAFLLGGHQAVVDTLCRSLGLAIDHYVLVRLPDLRSIVDEVGGFELTVDHPTRDPVTGLRLEAGTSRLDGNETLSYIGARNLEELVDGDWVPVKGGADRASHATTVLKFVGRQLDVSLRHPLRTHRRLWVLLGAVVTDDGFGPRDALALRDALGNLDHAEEIALPVRTTPDAAVPVDQLAPGAGQVLAEFDGPERSEACEPHLREAVER